MVYHCIFFNDQFQNTGGLLAVYIIDFFEIHIFYPKFVGLFKNDQF